MTREQFWASLDRSGECWHWTGIRNGGGYGSLSINGEKRPWLAHRLAYTLGKGTIPAGLCVCHRCDNPTCCNPEHLFVGTYADNNRDMTAKGHNHNTRKTHCPRGHEYTAENTVQLKNGGRWCRACEKARGLSRYREKHPDCKGHYRDRTHCKRGHEFTPENTYHWQGKSRICRTCAAMRRKAAA